MTRQRLAARASLTWTVPLLAAACGSSASSSTSVGPSASGTYSQVSTGSKSTAPTLSATPTTTASSLSSAPAQSTTGTLEPSAAAPSTSAPVSPTSSNPSTSSASASGTASAASSSSSGATTHPPEDEHSHCVMGYEVHPSDDTVASGFAEYTENGQTDAILQPEIIAWMEENEWQEAHFQWHEVRRCGGAGGGFGGGFGGGGGADEFDPCDYPELAPDANECENAQDGYEFLVMHRHMLQSLRQLWPSHTDQFEGWEKWPEATDYPELLRPYFKEWSDSVLQEASIADNIEDNLDMFADEGELGMWLQCGSLRGGVGANSLHGALHFNGYPQNNQSHSVANQRRNLDSFIFWKLHGWIDRIWERYRVAKGLTAPDERLSDELVAQCLEMDALAHYVEAGGKPPEDTPLPEEAGFFHEVVRPGLEDFGCATCHGAGEDAGLRLGYEVSSSEIVARIVNIDSAYAVGYKLVVPGDPDNSWLYIKAAGLATSSGAECQGVMNCTQNMPPGGGQLPTEALANLRQWIEDGAPSPTTVSP